MDLINLKMEDLDFHERCGAGSFGSVYKATLKSKSIFVAAKKLQAIDREAEVLSLLSHRHIVRFFGVISNEPNFYIVTEYAINGSLYNYLQGNANLNIKQVLDWAKQISMGMNYLHCEAPSKVIHRDLKSNNVVLSSDWICKICDFGASRFLHETEAMTLVGTYPWMAPEVIQSLPATDKCDVWSFGVVLWELITHEIPFKGLEKHQIAWAVVMHKKQLPIPSSCPEELKKLMLLCWQFETIKRPTFYEIKFCLEELINEDFCRQFDDDFQSIRKGWKCEIALGMEKLKLENSKLKFQEAKLFLWKESLQRQDLQLKNKYKALQLNSHDVNSWTEEDVSLWISQISKIENKINEYSSLFLDHNINGKRLLMLSIENIKNFGILSHGHLTEIYNEIQLLKQHNHRLQNYPPLKNSPSGSNIGNITCSKTIILLVSLIAQRRPKLEDTRWKLYLDVDIDPNDICNDFYNSYNDFTKLSYRSNVLPHNLIKHVAFLDSHSKKEICKCYHAPFAFTNWIPSLSSDLAFDCIVCFKEDVKRPKSTILHYAIDLSDLNFMQYKVVSINIQIPDVEKQNTPNVSQLPHSYSTPLLNYNNKPNKWNLRQLQNSVDPARIRKMSKPETVWADIVSGQRFSDYPAFKPAFEPIPPLLPLKTNSMDDCILNFDDINTNSVRKHNNENIRKNHNSENTKLISNDSVICHSDSLEDSLNLTRENSVFSSNSSEINYFNQIIAPILLEKNHCLPLIEENINSLVNEESINLSLKNSYTENEEITHSSQICTSEYKSMETSGYNSKINSDFLSESFPSSFNKISLDVTNFKNNNPFSISKYHFNNNKYENINSELPVKKVHSLADVSRKFLSGGLLSIESSEDLVKECEESIINLNCNGKKNIKKIQIDRFEVDNEVNNNDYVCFDCGIDIIDEKNKIEECNNYNKAFLYNIDSNINKDITNTLPANIEIYDNEDHILDKLDSIELIENPKRRLSMPENKRNFLLEHSCSNRRFNLFPSNSYISNTNIPFKPFQQLNYSEIDSKDEIRNYTLDKSVNYISIISSKKKNKVKQKKQNKNVIVHGGNPKLIWKSSIKNHL